jgi:phytoene dehydrogenase-like protein
LLERPSRSWEAVVDHLLAPPLRVPRSPRAIAPLVPLALRSAAGLAHARFRGEHARALFAGNAAHSMRPLTAPGTAAFGLTLLLLGHAVGWPVAAGGSASITAAMASYLRSLGGEIATGRPVRSLADLPPARVVLLDVTPRQALAIAGAALAGRYRRSLERFRYGPGVFKADFALAAPAPWTAAACREAGTVHLGGTCAEVVEAEGSAEAGEHADRPFVLVAQQSLVDPARAPDGQHTLWAYCHVANGSRADMTAAIERQIERFAPGFGALVLARHVMDTAAFERHNPNDVGGDINGGSADLRQLLARPVLRRTPYATPDPRLFLCSASTPPGGGVHGMCGWHAAQAALRVLERR